MPSHPPREGMYLKLSLLKWNSKMYSTQIIAVFFLLFFTSVHASEKMKFEGEIKNGLSHDVYLYYQSWETGEFAEEDLVVSAGGHVGFNFLADPRAGEIYFALVGGDSGNRAACVYDIKYGPRTYVRGAVTLTGPSIWTDAQSQGKKPVECSITLDDWDYTNNMRLSFTMK